MSTTFVRAAGTRVQCTPMRGSVPPSRRQRAAIEFEFLPSSAFYFLAAGEDRPFETRVSEVIDRSKKELLSRYGRGGQQVSENTTALSSLLFIAGNLDRLLYDPGPVRENIRRIEATTLYTRTQILQFIHGGQAHQPSANRRSRPKSDEW